MCIRDSYCAPDTMDQKGITAMQTTAKAISQILKQQQEQEARQRAARSNVRGFDHILEVGDKVCFFIPPTAREAEQLGRKAKHIAHYKGPALITRQLSSTTFAIKYKGRIFNRCLSELRPYRSDEQPNLVGMASKANTDLKIINFVALSDTDDPHDPNFNTCHVVKIINIADGQVHIQNYATLSTSLTAAVWRPLYQLPTGVYTTVKPKRNANKLRVVDLSLIHI